MSLSEQTGWSSGGKGRFAGRPPHVTWASQEETTTAQGGRAASGLWPLQGGRRPRRPSPHGPVVFGVSRD